MNKEQIEEIIKSNATKELDLSEWSWSLWQNHVSKAAAAIAELHEKEMCEFAKWFSLQGFQYYEKGDYWEHYEDDFISLPKGAKSTAELLHLFRSQK